MNKILVLLTLLVISSTSVYAGGSHKGGHAESKGHWQAPESAIAEPNPVPADHVSLNVGKNIYSELCARCHGTQLEGNGADGRSLTIAPTNLREMSGRHSDGDFAWKIRNGKGDMPAWDNELDDKEIWSLVNYIQSVKKGSSSGHESHSHSND
jgi:mono/diheme cytochrome c family protein